MHMSLADLREVMRILSVSQVLPLMNYAVESRMENISNEIFDPRTPADRLVVLQQHGSALLSVQEFWNAFPALVDKPNSILQEFATAIGIHLVGIDSNSMEVNDG